jgi:hypothetical protein
MTAPAGYQATVVRNAAGYQLDTDPQVDLRGCRRETANLLNRTNTNFQPAPTASHEETP